MIEVSYSFRIPTTESITAAASAFCNSVCNATWTELDGGSYQFSELARPHLMDITQLEEPVGQLQTVIVRFAFAAANIDPVDGCIPSLLNVIAGDVFELKQFRDTRLLDVKFPDDYLDQFPGPRYGLNMASELTGKIGSIPLGAIIKPRLGLAPAECAKLAFLAAKGGADFVRDDEIIVNPAYCPLVNRTAAVCEALERGWKIWQRNIPFYSNVSGSPTRILKLAEQALEAGARGLYINVITTGFSGLRTIREHFNVPLIAGRDMYALLSRSDRTGIALSVIGKLARMTGADMFYVGSVAGKLRNEVLEIQALVRALTQDQMGKMAATLPLVSCGVHPGNVHLNVALLGREIAFQAGGGIHGHPNGSTAGARAMRAAITLAEKGIPIEDYGGYRGSRSLELALDKWNLFSVSESLRGLVLVEFEKSRRRLHGRNRID